MGKTFAPGELVTAADVNTELNPYTAAHLAMAVHVQLIGVTVTAARFADVAVTWPAGRFTQQPMIVTGIHGAGGDVSAVSRGWTTSTTAGMVRVGLPATGSGTFQVWVLAMQMTPSSTAG